MIKYFNEIICEKLDDLPTVNENGKFINGNQNRCLSCDQEISIYALLFRR